MVYQGMWAVTFAPRIASSSTLDSLVMERVLFLMVPLLARTLYRPQIMFKSLVHLLRLNIPPIITDVLSSFRRR
jgi:hypothetical protein